MAVSADPAYSSALADTTSGTLVTDGSVSFAGGTLARARSFGIFWAVARTV
jgi:hypothetical protein